MQLLISNHLNQIRRAAEAVEEFRRRHGLAERDANAINVVLDEILSNVIRYGFTDTDEHFISVGLNFAEGEIEVTIEDDGVAFDPTQVPAPTLAGSLIERRPSGLGMVFVRSLTDSVEYRRVSERNCLVLRRRVAEEDAAVEPAQPFRVSESALKGGRHVAIVGRLDSPAAKMVRDRLLQAIHEGPVRLAVDLSRVPYISSSGLWALLAAEYFAGARGGGLVVFGASAEVRGLLESTGVAGTLKVCDTTNAEEALATLRPAAPR